MNVCFLFGSGASVPAGFPTVAAITEQIVSESSHAASLFVASDTLANGRSKFLRWLGIQIKRRYDTEGDHAVHYENLYFLAKQLHDDLLDEYDNPALRPFVEAAIEQVLPRTQNLPGNAHDELRKLTEDLIKHVRRTVFTLLSSHQPTRLDHLDFVLEAIQEAAHPKPALLTLNHDLLLETVLNTLEFTDGFTKEPNSAGVREWQPGQLVSSN